MGKPLDGAAAATPAEAMDYVCEMLTQLRLLVQEPSARDLLFLLAMAREEAARLAREERARR